MYFVNKNIGDNEVINVDSFIQKKKEGDNLVLITSTEKLSQIYNLRLLHTTQKSFHTTGIYSFNKFIRVLYSEVFGKEIIDEIVENEIILQSLSNTKENSNNSSNINYNQIIQMTSIIRGLREDGIRAKNLKEDLLAKIEKKYLDNDRLEYLIQIMVSYETKLGELDLVDMPLALEKLINHFKDKQNGEKKKYIFTHFISFRKPDIEILEALTKAGNSIIITTNYEEQTAPKLGEENFFITDLLEIGFELKNNKNEIIEYDRTPEDAYEQSLKSLIDMGSKNFNLLSYQNIREEVYGVTKLVKYLLLGKNLNLKPSDICVVSRKASEYSLLFREFFADNKIPTNVTDRYELSKSQVAIGIIRVLETVVNSYDGKSVINLLDSPFLDTGIQDSYYFIHIIKKYRLVNILPAQGVLSYSHIIESRLKGLENALNEDRNNIFLNREQKELENIKSSFKTLDDKFKSLNIKSEYTIDEFVALNKKIIEEFKVRDKILELNNTLKTNNISFDERVFYSEKIEQDSRALAKYLELLRTMKQIDKFSSNQRYTLSELIDRLKNLVSTTRYQIREKKGFGVDITSIEQTRGYDYKVKILVGAVEGMTPIPFRTERLVGKMMQDSEKRHYFQEYIQFYEFLNSDSEFYIFTHCENNSEIVINSHFISPIEQNSKTIISNENSGLAWQNAIINKREEIVNGLAKPTDNVEKKINSYASSSDLKIDLKLLNNEDSSRENNNVYSDTQLEKFKDRPYEYFYNRLLKLDYQENPDIYLSRLEIGGLIHKSIESTFNLYITEHKECIKGSIYSTNESQSLNYIELTEKDKSAILKLFKDTSLEIIERYQYQHQFYDLDKILLVGDDNRDGIMVKWFERIIHNHIEEDYYILANEFKFNEVEIQFGDKTAFFSGKIDRIDISKDLKYFRIIDYKSSEKSEGDNQLGMQLVIYAMAMKSILKNDYNIEAEPNGLIYDYFRFNSKNDELLGYKDLLVKKAFDEIRDNKLKEVFELIEQIEKLDFSKVKKSYSPDRKLKQEYQLLMRD